MSRRVSVRAILWYQRMSEGRVSQCRYVPSCSQYAIDAIEEYGTLRGIAMGTWRICRCQPFGGSGYDPVPQRTKVNS